LVDRVLMLDFMYPVLTPSYFAYSSNTKDDASKFS
jgi:hypothetical protein